jgi:hypothetical protein
MVYYNIITNQMAKTKPLESRGGVLADDVITLPYLCLIVDGSWENDQLSCTYV